MDDEQYDELDECVASVSLCLDVNTCDCCGKDNLKRTVHVSLEDGGELYLGVICAGQWFKINMSGNPYYAADRLNKKIESMTSREIEALVDDIQEANEN